jgi:hypothetical protein
MAQWDTGWRGSGGGFPGSRLPVDTSPDGQFHAMSEPEFAPGPGFLLASTPLFGKAASEPIS